MASPVEDLGAKGLRVVTPNNDADLPMSPCRALWVGVGGTIAVIASEDSAAVTLTVDAGLVPVRAKRVLSTGTTATDIVAMY